MVLDMLTDLQSTFRPCFLQGSTVKDYRVEKRGGNLRGSGHLILNLLFPLLLLFPEMLNS